MITHLWNNDTGTVAMYMLTRDRYLFRFFGWETSSSPKISRLFFLAVLTLGLCWTSSPSQLLFLLLPAMLSLLLSSLSWIRCCAASISESVIRGLLPVRGDGSAIVSKKKKTTCELIFVLAFLDACVCLI